MSFEVFEKLEAKVQQAVDTITLLQMEIDELKEKNHALKQDMDKSAGEHSQLISDNQQLRQEQAQWQERLRSLLGKMEEV